jgi:hypothetical protein
MTKIGCVLCQLRAETEERVAHRVYVTAECVLCEARAEDEETVVDIT